MFRTSNSIKIIVRICKLFYYLIKFRLEFEFIIIAEIVSSGRLGVKSESPHLIVGRFISIMFLVSHCHK